MTAESGRDGISLLLVAPEGERAARCVETLEAATSPAFEIVYACEVEAALQILSECDFAAVLLDLAVADCSDLDALLRMRVAAAEKPIVVIGVSDRPDAIVNALRAGAQDYLMPDECRADRLPRAIHQAVERHGIRAELVAARHREHHLATHDSLTGIANRESFVQQIPSALAHAERNDYGVALLFVDLDHFKAINDSLGHAAGDQLLKFVSERLSMVIRTSDMRARLAGDEFVVLARDVNNAQAPATLAQNLLDILSEPYLLEGHECWITASIGVAVFPTDGRTGPELLRNSDMAMYRAKLGGRNGFQFCTDSMNAAAARRIVIRDGLHEALERDRLALAYQPIRCARTGRVTAVEALLRWTDPEARDVPPEEFIPVAEDTGLIVPIGEWVLHTACAQARKWQDRGYRPIRLSVNISPRQLRQHTLVATVARILRSTGLSADLLDLEITESAFVQGDAFTLDALAELSQLGIGLSMDDFGTGYCAFGYLKKFQFERIKLDRTFVADVAGDSDASALAGAILSLARVLGLSSVVEGVETEEQAEVLIRQGCDELQGFLVSPPLDPNEFERFLDREKAAV